MPSYTYWLRINENSGGEEFYFKYGNTKNVSLFLSDSSAAILADITRDYSNNLSAPYLINLFKEGIKRLALIHFLRYQKTISISSVTLECVKSGEKIQTANYFDKLHQLIKTPLCRAISDEWADSRILQSVLCFQKTKRVMSKEISALYAYLYSKTKEAEVERFAYLWMAMNGFFAAQSSKKEDREAMNRFVAKEGLGSEVLVKSDREYPCKMVMLKLIKEPEPITRKSLESGEHTELAEYIEHILASLRKKDGTSYKLSPYGFMITDFPYELRCNFFHANRPMELFSFQDDMEMKSIRVANGLLEEFLDENIQKLFVP